MPASSTVDSAAISKASKSLSACIAAICFAVCPKPVVLAPVSPVALLVPCETEALADCPAFLSLPSKSYTLVSCGTAGTVVGCSGAVAPLATAALAVSASFSICCAA